MSLVLSVSEYGYEQAALGFSLSYNTTVERAKVIMPKYAWGSVPGENKFLRVMSVWIDCRLPRFMWQEADQYKVGTVTLSQSTVHTLKRRLLTAEDCTPETDYRVIEIANEYILKYRAKQCSLLTLKSNLPEGFYQTRVWFANYATIQNYAWQRKNHPVELWDMIIDEVVSQLAHPEFVVMA